MSTKHVQLSIDLGHPEIMQSGGIVMILSGLYTVGGLFCVLGAITAISRTAMRIQKAQAEIEAKQATLNQVSEAGGELVTALASIFAGVTNNSVIH